MTSQRTRIFASSEHYCRGTVRELEPCLAASTMGLWDLTMRPKSSRGFYMERDFLTSPRALVYIDHYHQPVHILGASKPEYLTLALPLQRSTHTSYYGTQLDNGQIVGGFDASVDAFPGAGHRHIVMLVHEEALATRFSDEDIGQLRHSTRGLVLTLEQSVLTEAQKAVLHLLGSTRSAEQEGELNTPGNLVESLILDTIEPIVRSLITPQGTPKPSMPARRQGFDRALLLIESTPTGTNLSVAELARSAGVSQRTLEYAFTDYLQCPPKQFLKERQYQQLRRRLLLGKPGITVRQAAADLGLYEFGRLAGEYRRLFGELPSQTLARNDDAGPGVSLPAPG